MSTARVSWADGLRSLPHEACAHNRVYVQTLGRAWKDDWRPSGAGKAAMRARRPANASCPGLTTPAAACGCFGAPPSSSADQWTSSHLRCRCAVGGQYILPLTCIRSSQAAQSAPRESPSPTAMTYDVEEAPRSGAGTLVHCGAHSTEVALTNTHDTASSSRGNRSHYLEDGEKHSRNTKCTPLVVNGWERSGIPTADFSCM